MLTGALGCTEPGSETCADPPCEPPGTVSGPSTSTRTTGGEPPGSTGPGSVTTSGGTGSSTAPVSDDTSDDGQPPLFDVNSSDVTIEQPELEAVVYAHGPNTLYRLDPDTLTLEEIGPFVDCGGSVVDIAVDQDNRVYASAGGIYEVDAETVQCTQISASNFGNNLSFVPPGVLDPKREILVSYSGTQYRSLDVDTGVVTDHGSIPWSVAGDVVSINDGPTYVSVNFPGDSNHLILVDPTTGELIADTGPIGNENSVWGLGYWGGTVYAFSSNGNISEIQENMDGTTTASVITTAPATFWGAGSSTFAPVIPEG